jgi:predicted nuclease of predicted toxin-antitoxin system
MKILVDENIPTFTVEELRKLGHEVKDIRGTQLEGIDDSIIWQIAKTENRLLISTDKVFTHDHYRDKNHNGIILILLKQPTLMKIHSRIMNAITQYPEDSLKGSLLIIKDTVVSHRN